MEKAKAEVLRYLGHRNQEIPAELDRLIEDSMALMREAARPRRVSRTFEISFEPQEICLSGAALKLSGADIRAHLHGCEKAVLLAATLGVGADSLIRRYEADDLTAALILDACAAQLVEELCDELEASIAAEAASAGYGATGRFSPGYGDLGLDLQPQILDVLNAGRQIGLTCTENYILLPRKSVTAIIGLGRDAEIKTRACDTCSLFETCNFRKEGSNDGCSSLSAK